MLNKARIKLGTLNLKSKHQQAFRKCTRRHRHAGIVVAHILMNGSVQRKAKNVKNVARLIFSPKFAEADQRSLTILHEESDNAHDKQKQSRQEETLRTPFLKLGKQRHPMMSTCTYGKKQTAAKSQCESMPTLV